MSDQKERKAGMPALDVFCNLSHIGHKCPVATFVHETEVFVIYDAIPMPSMVVSHADESLGGQMLHGREKSFLTSAHSVGKLNYCEGSHFGIHDGNADVKVVEIRS